MEQAPATEDKVKSSSHQKPILVIFQNPEKSLYTVNEDKESDFWIITM